MCISNFSEYLNKEEVEIIGRMGYNFEGYL